MSRVFENIYFGVNEDESLDGKNNQAWVVDLSDQLMCTKSHDSRRCSFAAGYEKVKVWSTNQSLVLGNVMDFLRDSKSRGADEAV
jgi:hypothetical protein